MSALSRQYLRQLQGVILRHALHRGEVHADHAVAVLPVPDGVHANTVGQAFAGLEAAGLIATTGFERSRRARRHGGISRIWTVADAAGAQGYLRALDGTGDDVGAEVSHAAL